MGSSYCGLQIRTTHITGMVTDIGLMLGHWVRHRWVERRRLLFFFMMFLGFSVGGFGGAWADLRYGPLSLLLPATICILAGLGYILFVHLKTDEMLPEMPTQDRRNYG